MTLQLEAFTKILPTLPAKRRMVYEQVLAQGDRGATYAELVSLMQWGINRVSGRVTELFQRGYVREAGARGGQTVWAACLPHEVQLSHRPRTVKARVESIEEPDLFGRTRILVSITSGDTARRLKTSDTVGIRL